MDAETDPTRAPRTDWDAIKQALVNAQTALRCGQIATATRQLDAVDVALKAMAKERGLPS
jgi:hypothetical protein